MNQFKIAVTVTHKKDKTFPIWNKVHLCFDGDKNDLLNLQRKLNFVKAEVNHDVNKKGFALRDVDIHVEFV